MKNEEVSVKRIDHHGIVAGVIKDLGIVAKIDELLGSNGNENVTDGECVAAMIINGLGFTDKPLSLSEEFFDQLPTEALIGTGISSDQLNRHRLGRALDAVFSFGTVDLFSTLAKNAAIKDGIDTSRLALDTTSFSFTGDYDEEADVGAVKVSHGYSKDHRPDLKQVVVELIASHDHGVPLVFKTHDGNASDSKIFAERCRDLVDNFDRDSEALLSADSKLYCEANAENLAKIRFVTRIPATNSELLKVLDKAIDGNEVWTSTSKDIYFKSYRLTHYDMDQNWLVCHSEQSHARAAKSIAKAVAKERQALDKSLFHLQAERFSCEIDARKALAKIKAKYHSLQQVEVIELAIYEKKGRPKINAVPTGYRYQITALAEENAKVLTKETFKKACFVLATNCTEMNAEQVISGYKMQTQVELGFRFLKSPIFYAQSFYLKKPERIEAMLMIMTLSLLVYSIAQRRIRLALNQMKPIIADSAKKPTNNPTLNRVFQVFQGISIVLMDGQNKIYAGIKDFQIKILEVLGRNACAMYGHHFAKT